MPLNAGALTDAQARSLVIKSLRNARRAYRTADTIGERVERELDRLIKRKTRINANSLATVSNRYAEYNAAVDLIQQRLEDAFNAAANF